MADINPDLDLVLDRTIDVPVAKVWAAWTEPELIKQWFTPVPWKTVDCALDLRPGGKFHTVMQSPEGERFPNTGCFLEVIPLRRLTWTSALGPDFRPVPKLQTGQDEFLFTATLTFTEVAGGTRYIAHVLHADIDGQKRHAAMGFHSGWGAALDQLVALMKRN